MSETCPRCGDDLLGDGYTLPFHCINAYEEDWWYSEPDSGPWYCNPETEDLTNDK